MKKKLKSILAITFMLFAFSPLVAVSQQQKAKPWPVPAEFKNKANPVKANAASIADGKEAYKKCSGCHGKTGLGDGPKAASLKKTIVPSFAKKSLKTQPDGQIYYQSIVGRDEMPNFEKKITDEADRWALIYYIKSL